MKENKNKENKKDKNEEKTENKKNNFILYHEMYESIEKLPNELVGDVIKSIFRYSMFGELPDYPNVSIERVLFIDFKKTIDINNKKYNETCEKNKKNAEKRWEKKKEEEQEDEIKQDVSVVFIGNDKLTKEEYEKKYDSKKTSFNDILQDQLKYIKEKNIDQLKKEYKCNFVSEETIKREYGIE